MKILFTSLCILFFQFSIFSQTEDDYKNTLELVKKAFNEGKATLIHEKFNDALKGKLKPTPFKKTIDSLHNNKGEMSSYELILEEEKERNYLVEFENGTLLMLLHLTSDGKISTFVIKEY
ncbi:hypothetical protein [Tenacibaculum sp. 190524A05c]|uniref:DUF3887 domain-containing protein n=1 Tax=Tenacibaculum platacis TaxID=3137852 RepID=A0ABM9P3S2_9FLAO